MLVLVFFIDSTTRGSQEELMKWHPSGITRTWIEFRAKRPQRRRARRNGCFRRLNSYRWSEDIDRQHNWSAFSLSRLKFFFVNSTRALFFDSNFKISTRVFFFVREHIFCKSRLIFFIAFDVFSKFRLKYYVFNIFYYRYNFVRNGMP